MNNRKRSNNCQSEEYSGTNGHKGEGSESLTPTLSRVCGSNGYEMIRKRGGLVVVFGQKSDGKFDTKGIIGNK